MKVWEDRFDVVVLGSVVTTERTVPRGWVAVRDGRIAMIGEGSPPEAASTHDAGDAFQLPSLIDGKTHATSYDGLSGIETTTRGAAAGGVIMLVDMPYDNPDPLSTPERFRMKIDAVEAHAHCDKALYVTVERDEGARRLRTSLRTASSTLGCVSWRICGKCASKRSSALMEPPAFVRSQTSTSISGKP